MRRDPALHQLITAIAREYGQRVVYDTHFDAFNWEIRWWTDGVLNAVDIQPCPEGRIEVTRLRTRYPTLPRLLAWARRILPMFPQWGITTRDPLARLVWPSDVGRLREVIVSELPRVR